VPGEWRGLYVWDDCAGCWYAVCHVPERACCDDSFVSELVIKKKQKEIRKVMETIDVVTDGAARLKNNRRQRGTTLIELSVVIAVLLLLVGRSVYWNYRVEERC
jgi:prepilin-type N-terminal cleavage/methylation domain-containing protein